MIVCSAHLGRHGKPSVSGGTVSREVLWLMSAAACKSAQRREQLPPGRLLGPSERWRREADSALTELFTICCRHSPVFLAVKPCNCGVSCLGSR